MPTVDELFDTFDNGVYVEDSSYPHYNLHTEPIYVPVKDKVIGNFDSLTFITGESNVNFVGFVLPRYVESLDLTTGRLYVHYEAASGGDSTPCNVSYSDEKIRLLWNVPGAAVDKQGIIRMMIYATGSINNESIIWKTLPATKNIEEGLEIGGGIVPPDNSWYEQFLARMESQIASAQGFANGASISKDSAATSASEAAQAAVSSIKAFEDNKIYVEKTKEAFVGYNKQETDSKYANAIIGSVSGRTQVSIKDAWEAPIENIKILGECEQKTTTGAQLFDYSKIPTKTAGGATVVNNGDGSFTVSGTGKTTEVYHNRIPSLIGEDARKVIGKETILSVDASVITRPFYTFTVTGNGKTIELNNSSRTAPITVTEDMINADDYEIRFGFYLLNDVEIIPGVVKPMINVGTTSLLWEYYTEGQSSPNPKYPWPVVSVGTVSTGAQLLDIPSLTTKTQYGITFTPKADGTVVVTGESTAVAYMPLISETTLPQGNYYISGTPAGGSFTTYETIVYKISTPENFDVVCRDIGKGAIFKAEADVKYEIRIVMRQGSSGPLIFKPMLNMGNIILPWEPYTGGKLSPSLEYPQNIVVQTNGVQLLDSSLFLSKTTGGITFTNNGDGSITVKGIATSYANTIVSLSLVPGTYVVSGTKNGARVLLRVVNTEGVFTDYENGKPYVVTGNEATVSVYIQVDKNTSADAVVWPMLNAGDTVFPWEPYSSKIASIQLTAPLYGIGAYKDQIVCKNGEWGIERYLVKKTYTGQEGFGILNELNQTYLFYESEQLQSSLANYSKLYYCNYFIAGNASTVTDVVGSYLFDGTLRFRVNKDTATTIGEFKNWLLNNYEAGHPVEVIYPAITPIWEPLPEEIQLTLSQLYSHKVNCSVVLNVEANLFVNYVKDTNKVIEDLYALIDNLSNK